MIEIAFYVKKMQETPLFKSLSEDKQKEYYQKWCKLEDKRDLKEKRAFDNGAQTYPFKGMIHMVNNGVNFLNDEGR